MGFETFKFKNEREENQFKKAFDIDDEKLKKIEHQDKLIDDLRDKASYNAGEVVDDAEKILLKDLSNNHLGSYEKRKKELYDSVSFWRGQVEDGEADEISKDILHDKIIELRKHLEAGTSEVPRPSRHVVNMVEQDTFDELREAKTEEEKEKLRKIIDLQSKAHKARTDNL